MPWFQLTGVVGGMVVIVSAAAAILFTIRSNAASVWRSTAEGWEAKARELDLELQAVRARMALMETEMAQLKARTNVLPLIDATREIKALLDGRTAIIHRLDGLEQQAADERIQLFTELRTHVFPMISEMHSALVKPSGQLADGGPRKED